MAPGVGTATPMTSSAISRNDPVNGTARRKATATAHMPDGDRQPQRERPEQRDEQTARLAHGAEPARELLGHARDEAGERRRQDLLEPRHRMRPRRSGIAGEHEHDDERRERAAAGGARPPTSPRPTPSGSPAPTPRIEHEDERRQQRQHGQHVEHALEDDRRERAGRRHVLVPREKIWANDLACARRQNAARRKSDGRRAKCVREARVARAARAGTASAASESPGSQASWQQRQRPASGGARARFPAPTCRKSTLRRNSTTSAAASARTTAVRMCERMTEIASYYNAQSAAEHRQPLHLVVVLAARSR